MSSTIFRYCPLCATPLIEKCVDHIQRATCPNCAFIQYLHPNVVAIVVVQQAKTLLLGKRAIEPGKDLWSFFGGYVEQGEKVEDAARREVKEETNLDVQLEGLIGIYSEQDDPHVLVVYEASVINAQTSILCAQSEEVSELAFFLQHELPTLAFPVDKEILYDWKKRKM